MILVYSSQLGLSTTDDVRHAMEMLISKAARAIEKYCDAETAVHVLGSTIAQLEHSPVVPPEEPKH